MGRWKNGTAAVFGLRARDWVLAGGKASSALLVYWLWVADFLLLLNPFYQQHLLIVVHFAQLDLDDFALRGWHLPADEARFDG